MTQAILYTLAFHYNYCAFLNLSVPIFTSVLYLMLYTILYDHSIRYVLYKQKNPLSTGLAVKKNFLCITQNCYDHYSEYKFLLTYTLKAKTRLFDQEAYLLR